MNESDFLIIGGGIAGTTAAETIRSENPTATITVLEADKYPLYSKVQIPHYIKGLKTREQIFLRSFESYKEKNIEFLINKTVTKILPKENTVITSTGENFSYKKLLITTGGDSKKLNKYKNEHYMQTIDDADGIIKDLNGAKKGVVIGSGFISLEFLEIFLKSNLPTTLCVSAKGFWGSILDKRISEIIENCLRKNGVTINTGTTPDFIEQENVFLGVGIGIDTNKNFFLDCGLSFENGLVADSTLKTNFENIYVAGDLANFESKKLRRRVRYGNWTNAIMSGKCAAANMLSKNQDYDTLSSYSISLENLSVVFLGFTGVDAQTQVQTEVNSDVSGAQFFIRDGKLDGCVLVNRSLDRKKYQAIIESREGAETSSA